MKKIVSLVFAFLFLASTAIGQTVFAPPREYNETVSATDTSSEVAFGFAATEVLVINDGTDEVYITFESGTATTAMFPLNSGEYINPSFKGGQLKPRVMGIVCDTGETATVRVIAWAEQ